MPRASACGLRPGQCTPTTAQWWLHRRAAFVMRSRTFPTLPAGGIPDAGDRGAGAGHGIRSSSWPPALAACTSPAQGGARTGAATPSASATTAATDNAGALHHAVGDRRRQGACIAKLAAGIAARGRPVAHGRSEPALAHPARLVATYGVGGVIFSKRLVRVPQPSNGCLPGRFVCQRGHSSSPRTRRAAGPVTPPDFRDPVRRTAVRPGSAAPTTSATGWRRNCAPPASRQPLPGRGHRPPTSARANGPIGRYHREYGRYPRGWSRTGDRLSYRGVAATVGISSGIGGIAGNTDTAKARASPTTSPPSPIRISSRGRCIVAGADF